MIDTNRQPVAYEILALTGDSVGTLQDHIKHLKKAVNVKVGCTCTELWQIVCDITHTHRTTQISSVRGADKFCLKYCSCCIRYATYDRICTVQITKLMLHDLCIPHAQVTSTHMMLATEEDYNTGTPEDYLVAVSNCRTLHHLDLGMLPLSSNLWRAMPPCVQLLHAGAISDPDTSARGGAFSAWPQLPNLEFASLYSDGMPLCLLANLLRAAPKLSQISMGNVWVPSRVDQIPDLILLHKRMSEGLQIQEASRSRHDADLMLQFRDLPVLQHAESPATSFISSLPVFEHFAHVGVETVERPCYASLAKVFPRLSLLRISSMVAASSFPSLAKEFPALQILCLDSQQNTLTALQVGLLCLQMPSLQVLQVRSPGIDRKALKRGLRTWDHLVSITVLQELDEDED